jgi:DnaA family protein
MSSQIPLPFGNYDRFNFELYWPGPNRQAVDHLRQAACGESAQNIYLWGGQGTGKSHLLQAVCTQAAARQAKVIYIPLKEKSRISSDLLHDMESLDLVCIDDVEQAADTTEWEPAIFNLYNRMSAAGTPLIVSASVAPTGLPLQLPDLKSRLSAGVTWRLDGLEENDRLQALRQRARIRGFELPDEVVDYLAKRVARDMHSLFSWLDRMDKASLASKKKLTVPFIRDMLNKTG